MANILSVAAVGDRAVGTVTVAPASPSPEYLAWRAGERRRRRYIAATRVLLLALLLVVWEVLARTHVVNPMLTSYPSALWPAFLDLLRNGDLVGHT
jgi:NitT/TauT family transport system permease protein